MDIVYSSDAETDLARLHPSVAERIAKKMNWFSTQKDPLHFALPLQGKENLFRFRIGDYRIIFTLRKNTVFILFVLAVKHRGKAYK